MTIRDIAIAFGFVVDRRSERETENSIKGIKNLATKLLGAIGIGFSIAGISGLAEAAADAEALRSQFSQVFGELEDEAASKLEAIEADTGVLVNRMKGSFTQIAAFSKTAGVEQADALDIANRSMIAVADSAAFYDRSIEDMTNSLQSFLKGNFENDAALGLSCTETTRNTAANNLYKKSFKDLSEAEKQFTLLSMVEDANKASGALGQAARESDTWSNQLGNLKQSLQDLKAAAGSTILQPAVMVLKILVSLTQGLTKKIQDLTGETGILTRGTERFHALVKRLRPEVSRVGETLKKGITGGVTAVKGLIDRFGGLGNVLKLLAVVAGSFLAVMIFSKAITGVKALAAALKTVNKAMALAKLKVLAIVAVVAVLALIVEDFIHFMLGNNSVIGTVFDRMGIGADNARRAVCDAFGKIRDFLLGVWDLLKTAAGMWSDTVSGFFERHGDSIRANLERAWGIIKTFLKGTWTFLSQLASTLFGDAGNNIGDSARSVRDKLLAVWGAILEALSAIWDALYEIGNAVFRAMATVIETVFGWIQAFWETWGSGILSWFKTLWDSLGGILSAFLDIVKGAADFISSVFTGDWKGAWEAVRRIFSGIWEGMTQIHKAALETVRLLSEMGLAAVRATWEKAWNGIKAVFQGVMDWIKDKAGLDMSGILAILGNGIKIIGICFQAGFGNIQAIVKAAFTIIRSAVSTAMAVIRSIARVAMAVISGDWRGAWEGIKSLVSAVWEHVKTVVSTMITLVRTLIENDLGAIRAIWESVWGAISGFLQGIWNGILSFLQSVWDTITGGVSQALNGAYNTIASILTAIQDNFNGIFNNVAAFVVSVFSDIHGGIRDKVGQIKDAIVTGLTAAIDWIRGLPSQAVQWGADFIGGLKDGILSGVQGVVDAVRGVGETIRSYLHFSVPDVGPLTDYESWMPDFMGGLAQGISDNQDLVLDRVRGLAGSIQVLMSAATANPATAVMGAVHSSTSSVTQNVNIENSYSGGGMEAQKAVSRTMKKSATDATTQMARALAYARG